VQRALSRSLGLLLLLALVATGASAQSPRIGYIDMKRLLDSAPQIVASRAALAAEFAQRDRALKDQEAHLADLEAAQKRDAAILPKDVADARARELETLGRNVKRLRDRLRDDLNSRADQETSRAWASIQDTVIEYARANGYDLVVQSPVIYASATIDITDEVLEELQHPRGAGTPPP
jgi:outer membrane protein